MMSKKKSTALVESSKHHFNVAMTDGKQDWDATTNHLD